MPKKGIVSDHMIQAPPNNSFISSLESFRSFQSVFLFDCLQQIRRNACIMSLYPSLEDMKVDKMAKVSGLVRQAFTGMLAPVTNNSLSRLFS